MIYRSSCPDVPVPARPLADVIFEHAGRFGDKPAIIEGPTGRTLTYAELAECVRRAAAGFAARGLGKGDVCAIYSPNVPEYAIAFFAVARAGGVITTTNPLYTATELTHQLRDSGARMLVTTPQLLPTARQGAEQAGIEEIFTFGDAGGATPFRALMESDGQVPDVPIDAREDVVALPYSSGTTGLPKGVMLSHYNIVADVLQIEMVERVESSEVLLATLPFYHIYGMVVVMNLGLHTGATIVTMPRFEVKTFLEVMQRHRVTTVYLVPPLVRTLAKHPLVDRYDLSSLRYIVSGAAPLPEAIARACAQRNRCTVRQAYGLTETSSVTHLTPRDRARMDTVGLVLPNTQFRMVDVASRQDVPPGELGEVWIRGPQVMKGYLNNPEATCQMIDDEGWLHTGDIGYTDKDGYLYVVDRAKELIKFRGLHYEEHELLFAMVEDIAGRRQAASRVNFQALLLDSVRESVVATDLQHRVTFWNKGAEALFGYRAEEAIGRPTDALILPVEEDAQRYSQVALAELERQGQWKGQTLLRRRDGSPLWTDVVISTVTDADGQPSGFVAVHRDITEQKSVEQRLRFQAQLLDSVRESVVAVDFDGRVVFWGKGAEALFGHCPEEVLGQPLASLIFPVPADGSEAMDSIWRELLGKGTWNAQQPRRRKDGSQFLADIAVAPVQDGQGQPVGLIAIHRDITELQQDREMIRDSRERMRNLASSLMVIREQERSAIARELHDELGQELTRLKIDLCWLTERLPKYLRTKRARSMAPFVDGMLESVHQISSQLRPAILDDLGLEAAIEWQVQEFADWNGCRCRLDLKLEDLKHHRDRDTAVFRIVQEALTNVARHARAKVVTVRARVSGQDLMLEVEDDGVGLPESKLVSPHSLGLIGMRERAEGLGGQIEFDTCGAGGTVVSLRVPLEERAAS